MRTRPSSVICICLALLSFSAYSAEKRFDRSFQVSSGGELKVDADSSDIVVTGTDADRVVVQILAQGSQRAIDRLEMSAERTATGVVVRAKRRSSDWFGLSWRWGDMDGRVTVQVPRQYNVELKTSGGDLSVAQLTGNALGKTSGGDVRIEHVRGPTRMRTSGGDVTIESIQGDTELHTSGGDIVARSVQGDLEVSTSGGSIRVQDVRGAIQARTSSGDVMTANVRGDVELRTSGGDVEATAIDGAIDAHTSGGDIEAQLVGANRGISASSSGGSIVLRVPKEIRAALHASTSGGSISSDLPVAATAVAKRKLNGTINGGGELIQARTSGGNIRLRVN